MSQLTGIKDGKNPRPFVWGEAEQKAFEQLKECLCSKPVLATPDLSKEFIVTTDSSDFALGAILSQMDVKIKLDHACIYASRCLRGPELRYSTYDCELLAKDQFWLFLYGRKFKVITDHEPLKHFHNTKKSGLRFNRLKADLCGYEFEIEYRLGPRNCNADALSRNPIILEGEDNPERPRVNLYELATKQEEEDNYNEHDPPKVRYVTRSTKRDRLQANAPQPDASERLTSGSKDWLPARQKSS